MKFWEVVNKGQDEGELLLYGDIMDSKPWWSEGQVITPEDFLNDMAPLKNKSKIVIRINSRGGDVFVAQAIRDYLKQLSCQIEVRIEGLCASAATTIATGADKRIIGAGGQFMIHNPAITVWDTFESSDLEKLKNMLDSIKEGIIENYVEITGLPKEEISQLMDSEKWMTGREAVELGFCDELLEDSSITNSILNKRIVVVNNVAHDLSGFKNMPVFEAVKINNQKKNENQNQEGREVVMKSVDELNAAYPDLVNQIKNAAYEEGVNNERQRIKGIEEISNTISKELVVKAKFEEPMDAKELAFNAVKSDQYRASNFAEEMQADAEDAGTEKVTAEPDPSPENKVSGLVTCLNNDKRRK